MIIPSRTFPDIVRDMSAAITASAGRLVDLSVGSILRAIVDANAGIVSWVQWTILLVLQTTRAATSSGLDLDSWMADFGFSRLPSQISRGVVTFSRNSGAAPASIPEGTVVKTQDGAVSFRVIGDPSIPVWQPSAMAYSLAAGVMAIDLPVEALQAGTSGNIISNSVSLISSPIPGIDGVTNSRAMEGGQDPESDAHYRNRFTGFLAARSRATLDAIGYAIEMVGPQLAYVIHENVESDGTTRAGCILIIVNDGSGELSNSLFDSLSRGLAAIRPVGTRFSIQAPNMNEVSISLSVDYPTGMDIGSVQDSIRSAIVAYVRGLPIGGVLSLTRISQATYQADSRIINVSNVRVNGTCSDVTASNTSAFMCTSIDFV